MKTKQGREIRMAVFDLDGTLLTTDKRISDADRAAVRFLTDGGVKVVTASGRFPLTAAEMTAQLGLGLEDDLYIADGGGTICRAGKALRKINPMDREVYSTTTAASKALGFAPYAAAGDRVISTAKDRWMRFTERSTSVLRDSYRRWTDSKNVKMS